MNTLLEQITRDSGFEPYVFGKSLFLLSRDSKLNSELRKAIDSGIDTLLDSSRKLKDSRTTKAGIAEIAGTHVFIKRTHNKGIRYTFRYIFRPARVFRAAAAEIRLKKLGIETPEVIAVGEIRPFPFFLRAGYIINKSVDNASDAALLLKSVRNPEDFMHSFISRSAALLSAMHGGGMIHGDLKMSNFYMAGGSSAGDSAPGVWDLDGARLFPGEPPVQMIELELGRLASSLAINAPKSIGADVRKICAELMEKYSAAGHRKRMPSEHEVLRLAQEFMEKAKTKGYA